MFKVTIIVPVYNAESYLRQCIESIQAQTYSNLQCILINDGSTDNSPSICDEYAAKDSRIIAIHKQNAGVSSARNAGLEIALADKEGYIGFVDSDDWCEPEMFEFLYYNAEKHQADISACGIHKVKNGETMFMSKSCPDEVMNGLDARLKLFKKSKYFGGYCWNKLISKRLFYDFADKLWFDETIRYSEDRLFLYILLMRAKTVFYSHLPYYNYRQHNLSVNGSGSKSVLTDAKITRFFALDKILSMETDKRLIIENKLFFSGWILRIVSKYSNKNNLKIDKSKYTIVKKYIRKLAFFILFCKKADRKKLFLYYFPVFLRFKLNLKNLKKKCSILFP